MASHPLPTLQPAVAPAGGLGRALRQAAATLRRWVRVTGQRRQLGELDAHQLRDIGLTRHEAAREARRHFWD